VEGFVQAQHALADLALLYQGEALQREPQHLDVGHPQLAADGDGPGGAGLRGGGVLSQVERGVAVQQRKPAMLRREREGFQQVPRALPPATGDGRLAPEVQVVGTEPHGHAGGAQVVSGLAKQPVAGLPRPNEQLRVIQPPGGPAQPFERLGGFPLPERVLEAAPRRRPVQPGQRVLPTGNGRRSLVSHRATPS
jgi:hypothetical protein